MTRYKGLWILAAGGVLWTTAACRDTRDTGAVTSRMGSDTSVAPPADVAERRDVAMVRVVNAIPGSTALTIWAGDSVAFSGVAYQSTSGWQQIRDDRFKFQIKSSADAEPLAENRENLQGGGHYTIVALPSEDANERNLRVLDDDLKPVPVDKARIRFINGIAGDTDVDLMLSGREDPLFDGVNFTHEAGWNEIAPTSGSLFVRPDNGQNALARIADVKLEGGKSYTFILTGRAGTYKLIEIEDDVAPEMDPGDARDTRTRVEP
jgi:hypothetical protein